MSKIGVTLKSEIVVKKLKECILAWQRRETTCNTISIYLENESIE